MLSLVSVYTVGITDLAYAKPKLQDLKIDDCIYFLLVVVTASVPKCKCIINISPDKLWEWPIH